MIKHYLLIIYFVLSIELHAFLKTTSEKDLFPLICERTNLE